LALSIPFNLDEIVKTFFNRNDPQKHGKKAIQFFNFLSNFY